MEHGGAGADQADSRRKADQPVERQIRARRAHPSWITFDQPHDTLTIRVAARIAVNGAGTAKLISTPAWEEVRAAAFASADLGPLAPTHYLFPSRQVSLDPEIRDYAASSFPPGRTVLDGATDLMNRIKAEFVYEVGATTEIGRAHV